MCVEKAHILKSLYFNATIWNKLWFQQEYFSTFVMSYEFAASRHITDYFTEKLVMNSIIANYSKIVRCVSS